MNKKNKANPTAQLALLIATMVVIEVLSQTIFAAFALPIKPTLTHIPVIIASIVYGPKIGAYLGGFMGIMSIVRNTIVYTVGSYLFSPFVEGGTWASAVIAIVPRPLLEQSLTRMAVCMLGSTPLLICSIPASLSTTIYG